jgi:hypothetical protein
VLPTGKAFGTNTGLRYSILIDEDVIRGGPLHNGTTYYYTVNAYSVAFGALPQVLESANDVIAVVPQTPPAGVDLSIAQASDVAFAQVTPNPVVTTDVVSVEVVNPALAVNATWKVGVKPACATCTTRLWYLIRTVGATSDTVIVNGSDFTGGVNSPVIDGIQVHFLSYPPGTLGNIAYVDTAGGNPQALVGVDRGLPFFDGGGGYAGDDLGSTILGGSPAPNTEIRFTLPLVGQKAYRYVREVDSTGAVTCYCFHDYVDVPFTVYDLDSGLQKNAAFVESQATMNGQWDPSTAGNGGREVLFVMASNYSGATPDPFYTDSAEAQDLTAGHLDLLYEVYSRRVSTGATIDAGDKLEFITSVPATANDFWTFSTTAPNTFNATVAKSELQNVLVVPNPYYAHSAYELNQFERVVKFTHLPAECTVRIYNLAGDLIRTLRKSDSTSQLSWDLETDRGLPVGSGIYVFHVEAPGVGSKVGKMAIFMEKERLNNF